jgi:hypothetical protein
MRDLNPIAIALFKRLFFTTWKVSDFVDREDLSVSGWHQYSQHFIAGFSFGKIPLT